jgi:hypothetical protein
VVLSGIVTPADHQEALEESWQTVSRQMPEAPPAAQMSPQADAAKQTRDPMAVLDALSVDMPDDARKTEVAYLRDIIKQNGMKLAVQTAQAARSVILSGIYTAESIDGYAMRRKTLANELNRLEKLKEESVSDSLRDIFDTGIASTLENIALLDDTIDYLADAYMTRVTEIQYYPEDVFESQLAFVARDLNREGAISRRLLARLELFNRHVQRQKVSQGSLDKVTVMNEIIE